MPAFARYIGIDYSGAQTPVSALPGLRVCLAVGTGQPLEVGPPSRARHWSRRGVAEWQLERLREGVPTLVGIDHGFSFPLAYFEKYGLTLDWPAFLEDFERHWPTRGDATSVDAVRPNVLRTGETRWRRLCERRAGGAKSVFHFDVPGQVAKSTHAGLPWLAFIRERLGAGVHFWPFDGWDVPKGRSAIAEVYPSLWRRDFERPAGLSDDQFDAFCITAWLAQTDRAGKLQAFLEPRLTPQERSAARVEGWILGVADGTDLGLPAPDGRIFR